MLNETERDLERKAYLGVEQSATGRKWVGPTLLEDRQALAIAQNTGLPDILCRVLARLGVPLGSEQEFLEPKLRDLMTDPSELLDMDAASRRFVSAVVHRQKIAIFADYDVDGASSAALLHLWLREHGMETSIYVPDRVFEGYGPNVEAMESLSKDHRLIVCVDCGTSALEPIAAASADVIVLDHHRGLDRLPSAVAIVNPNRQDETSNLGHLCAAGVVFLFLVAVNRLMKAERLHAPDLMRMLDIVSLATVADVVPLIGLNRAFVRQGLAVMSNRQRHGLTALADLAGLSAPPDAMDLGFQIAPRINAGGRLGRSHLGTMLLCAEDRASAETIAQELDALNIRRRELVASVSEEALRQAEVRGLKAPLVWAAGKDWHPGIVGIVAANLAEASGRPAVAVGLDGAVGRGSGRSAMDVDLGFAVEKCLREGHLVKGGGHRMAVGLEVESRQLEAAMERLGEIIDSQGTASFGPKDLRIDATISPKSATVEVIETLARAGPFGAKAPQPRWALASQRVAFCKVGEKHVSLTLEDEIGGRIKAVAFTKPDSQLRSALPGLRGKTAHFAGALMVDNYKGRRKPVLKIEDAAPINRTHLTLRSVL